MSQFNNPYPQQPYGQKPMSGPPYDPSPPRTSSGTNVILIILGIVLVIVVLFVAACVGLGFMASRAVSTLGKEMEGLIVEPMANEMVQRYQDHASVQEHIGEIETYHIENPGIDVVNRPVLRLEVEGDKGQGKIVFHRRMGRPQKVVLEVDGQEILLDDNPKDLFEANMEAPNFDELIEGPVSKDAEGIEGPSDSKSTSKNEDHSGDHHSGDEHSNDEHSSGEHSGDEHSSDVVDQR
ncbi:MAG: hypothetical protein JNK57_02425 [Planctomycetaceae bacterium]|nr:hypothetical protein [Planctomycetaceae bacterium]